MKRNMIVVGLGVCILLAACGREGESGVDEIDFQTVQQRMEDVESTDFVGERDEAASQVGMDENSAESMEMKEDASDSEIQTGVQEGEQSVNAELEGNIESIEDGGFTIAKIDIEEKDNGAQIAVANLGDKTFVRVTYNAATKFVICTVLDGINGQYTDAAASDLEEGRNVVLEGTYNDAGFAAQKVTIYDFR